jgi:hypothetical protein
MIIIGAGMAGLLAARMLSHRKPVIWEKQSALPNNHSAVLRFRTAQIGDILGIPFKRVTMLKDTLPWQNPIADSLAYSFKNTGQYRSDRSVVKGLVEAERFIAPTNLIGDMARDVDIEYGREFNITDPHANGVPIISTMPMPDLVEALDYSMAPDFEYRMGATITAWLSDCDAYISLLIPHPGEPASRISITGNQLIIELPLHPMLQADQIDEWFQGIRNGENLIAKNAANMLGIADAQIFTIDGAKLQRYNKINPVKDEARKGFMFWATKNFHIYSLGRFATWRPGLLLDDLVQDIRLIDRWIGRGGYDVALHMGRS